MVQNPGFQFEDNAELVGLMSCEGGVTESDARIKSRLTWQEGTVCREAKQWGRRQSLLNPILAQPVITFSPDSLPGRFLQNIFVEQRGILQKIIERVHRREVCNFVSPAFARYIGIAQSRRRPVVAGTRRLKYEEDGVGVEHEFDVGHHRRNQSCRCIVRSWRRACLLSFSRCGEPLTYCFPTPRSEIAGEGFVFAVSYGEGRVPQKLQQRSGRFYLLVADWKVHRCAVKFKEPGMRARIAWPGYWNRILITHVEIRNRFVHRRIHFCRDEGV